MASADLAFPLVPRHRVLGLPFGGIHSARRGRGSDVAGSRPYRPGDPMSSIDWSASARLSAAHNNDEFVVRERFADEAPRVVIVCDRRPAMALYPPELPWLAKPRALETVTAAIEAAAARARGFVGYLDYGDFAHPDRALRRDEPFWRPPHRQADLLPLEESADRAFHAPEDNLERAFDYLHHVRRSLPPGTFIFICSDFLVAPSAERWLRAAQRRWEVVPVVIQDPVWEQTFPDVAGIALPIVDAATGRADVVRLNQEETRELRERHEQRLARLMHDLVTATLDPVLISSADPEDVLEAFIGWATERLLAAGRTWSHSA